MATSFGVSALMRTVSDILFRRTPSPPRIGVFRLLGDCSDIFTPLLGAELPVEATQLRLFALSEGL